MAGKSVPEEILEGIFARMSTKPLLRLKCLSKYWNHVISTPRFMKLRSRRMILLHTLPLHTIDITESGDKIYEMVNLQFPVGDFEDKDVTIVGTYNGIVFVALQELDSSDEMILYNLFTRAYNIVPNPPCESIYWCNYIYGFCYDTTPDDLKIVRIEGEYSASDMKSCGVFSLKNNSWSTTSALIDQYDSIEEGGTFVNGFLYWIAKRQSEFILALNVKEMVFSEIQIPQGCSRISTKLGNFKGRLCLIYETTHSRTKLGEYEIKLMNEQGFGKSWSMLCNSFSLSRYIDYTCYFYELSILEDGKLVLLIWPNTVIIHDMLNDSYKKMKTSAHFSDSYSLKCFGYVDSLISPFNMSSL